MSLRHCQADHNFLFQQVDLEKACFGIAEIVRRCLLELLSKGFREFQALRGNGAYSRKAFQSTALGDTPGERVIFAVNLLD